MEFYQRIRELREDTEPHLKQEEIGLILGMTQRKVSRLETNKTQPTTEEIKKYCIYYNLSADYLLGLTDEKRPLK
ncbi:MAG: helix-turn-helix transcriptional regulator [Clostridia bacterium]|nr:helix-turn-helix transcriptional regulator [Clostridia bacterium]